MTVNYRKLRYAGLMRGVGKGRTRTEFWRGNLVGIMHFKDRERDRTITFRLILRRWDVKVQVGGTVRGLCSGVP
jgi:hypothetical protein